MDGKVAILTGGAGALGSAIGEALAVYGCDVVVVGRTKAALDAVVLNVERHGRKALAIACDVTDEDQVESLAEEVKRVYGKIDILFTTAGIAKRYAAEDFPAEAYRSVIDTNVTGTFLVCKHVGRVMKAQGRGKIVTISSVRGFAGHPGGYAAYGASKAAVDMITKQLATEWAKYGINVNSIAPTILWTALTQEVLEDEKLKKVFLDRIPLGRAAIPGDLVGAAIFLASAASDFVTGQVLYVDGGCTAG